MNIDFKAYIDAPHNENQLCALFSDLLFMRFKDNDSTVSDNQKRGKMRLSPKGERSLQKQNLINRIFRVWYQINWLNEDWSDDFKGATPRQELAANLPDIGTGEAMLSVALEYLIPSPLIGGTGKERIEVVPLLFESQEIEKNGGVFMYGLSELAKNPKGVVAPNYDPGFRDFASKMRKIKTKAESFPSYALYDMPERIVYWRLFIEQAVSGILSSLGLPIKKKYIPELHDTLSTLLMGHAGAQKDGECEYIFVDQILGHFWQALSSYDTGLRPYNEVIAPTSEKELQAERRNDESMHSRATLYLLGYLLDEQFLFPADRYFNAVEIVWQDKMHFIQNLSTVYYLLNNDLKTIEPQKGSDPMMQEEYKRFSMEYTAFNIDRIWFNPSN